MRIDMNTELEEIEIESSIRRQHKNYKDTFNPIYRQMVDECLI